MNWGVLGAFAFVACSSASEGPSSPPPSEVMLAPLVAVSATATPTSAVEAPLVPSALVAGSTSGSAGRGSVANAGSIIASMAKDFRRCWNLELAAPNAPTEAKGKLTMKLDPQGGVSSATATGFDSPTLTSCLETVGAAAKFDAPEGGTATIVAPLSFLPPP